MFEIRAIELGLEHVVARRAGTCAAPRCRRSCRAAARRCAGSARGPGGCGRCRCRRVMSGSPTATARDLHRGRQIRLLQRRRHAEHVRDVVEAVRGIVGRQERRRRRRRGRAGRGPRSAYSARFSRCRIGRAGIRMRGGLGVERGFERRLHGAGTSLRPAGGRPAAASTRACSLRTTFSQSSGFDPACGGIEAFEREPARLQTLAVTTDAVLVDRAGRRRAAAGAAAAACGSGAGAWGACDAIRPTEAQRQRSRKKESVTLHNVNPILSHNGLRPPPPDRITP